MNRVAARFPTGNGIAQQIKKAVSACVTVYPSPTSSNWGFGVALSFDNQTSVLSIQ